jgi:hypothetical protein
VENPAPGAARATTSPQLDGDAAEADDALADAVPDAVPGREATSAASSAAARGR